MRSITTYDAAGNEVAEICEDIPDDEGDGADEPITCYQDECGRWVWCFSLRGEHDVRPRGPLTLIDEWDAVDEPDADDETDGDSDAPAD